MISLSTSPQRRGSAHLRSGTGSGLSLVEVLQDFVRPGDKYYCSKIIRETSLYYKDFH